MWHRLTSSFGVCESACGRGVLVVVASTKRAAILRVIGITPVRYELLAGAGVMVGVRCFSIAATGPLALVASVLQDRSPEVVTVLLVVASLAGTASLPVVLAVVAGAFPCPDYGLSTK
jgi:hypothetical protein